MRKATDRIQISWGILVNHSSHYTFLDAILCGKVACGINTTVDTCQNKNTLTCVAATSELLKLFRCCRTGLAPWGEKVDYEGMPFGAQRF